jgi:hypothetical protein
MSLESKFNSSTSLIDVVSFGGVLMSCLLLVTPVKGVGYIGIGSGLGAFAASAATKKKHLQIASKQIDLMTTQHRSLVSAKEDEIIAQTKMGDSLRAIIKSLQSNVKTLESDKEAQLVELFKNQSCIHALQNENQQLRQHIEQVTNELDRVIDLARTTVEEALDVWKSKLSSLLTTKRELYPKLAERLDELLSEAQDLLTEYGVKLAEIPKKWDSLVDLLSLYHYANDDLSNIKTKAIQAIAKLTNQETQLELQEVSEILEEWQESDLVPREKVKGLVDKYEAMLSEFRLDLNNRFQETMNIAESIEGQANQDEEFFLRLRMKVKELEEKVSFLSKPLEYRPATRQDMKVSNIITRYFEALGVILDRAGSDYQVYEATLWFFTDRNPRLIMVDELNEHSDRLQALSHTLNSPQFKLDPESGLVSVNVALSKKPKTDSKDINRLWIPASQFEQTVKGWSRVRLTGGSESGKSPTAENLAVAILKNRPGVPKLYNPQHDSVKNYWTLPTVGTSHKDSEKGIASLVKQVDERANGQESRDVFELSIFDEIDSTMSHTKSKKSVIGGNVKFIIKQASHQNLGAIFIGQNANVSEYPGMDRSDWNSAVNVHLGANAYDAITNSNRFTHDEQSKLKQTADKITEFCNLKNDELGLEKTDPTAYRFALVIEPNKKPYFIELPAFGAYTFDQCQESGQGETNTSYPVTANSQKSYVATVPEETDKSGHPDMSGLGTSPDTSQKPTCPHCGSTQVRSKGDKWLCQNPEHSNVASDKPKSWKK